MFVRLEPMTEDEKLAVVGSYTSSHVHSLWQTELDRRERREIGAIDSLEDMLRLVVRNYSPSDAFESRRQRFEEMRQEGPARVFIQKLRELGYLLRPPPTDDEIKRRIRAGLRQNIKNELSLMAVRLDPLELPEFIAQIVRVDEILFKRTHRGHFNLAPASQSNPPPLSMTLPLRLNAIDDNEQWNEPYTNDFPENNPGGEEEEEQYQDNNSQQHQSFDIENEPYDEEAYLNALGINRQNRSGYRGRPRGRGRGTPRVSSTLPRQSSNPHQTFRRTPGPARNENTNVCYNCGGTGHWANACPHPSRRQGNGRDQ